jgi:hypothetical protein
MGKRGRKGNTTASNDNHDARADASLAKREAADVLDVLPDTAYMSACTRKLGAALEHYVKANRDLPTMCLQVDKTEVVGGDSGEILPALPGSIEGFFASTLEEDGRCDEAAAIRWGRQLLIFAGTKGRLGRIEVLRCGAQGVLSQHSSVGPRSADAAVTVRIACVRSDRQASYVLLIPANELLDSLFYRKKFCCSDGFWAGNALLTLDSKPTHFVVLDARRYAGGNVPSDSNSDRLHESARWAMRALLSPEGGTPTSSRQWGGALACLTGGLVLAGLLSRVDVASWAPTLPHTGDCPSTASPGGRIGGDGSGCSGAGSTAGVRQVGGKRGLEVGCSEPRKRNGKGGHKDVELDARADVTRAPRASRRATNAAGEPLTSCPDEAYICLSTGRRKVPSRVHR